MIYFLRGPYPNTEIACCETIERAWLLQAKGWQQVTREKYMATWRHRAAAQIEKMRQDADAQRPIERAVGER